MRRSGKGNLTPTAGALSLPLTLPLAPVIAVPLPALTASQGLGAGALLEQLGVMSEASLSPSKPTVVRLPSVTPQAQYRGPAAASRFCPPSANTEVCEMHTCHPLPFSVLTCLHPFYSET